MATKYRTIQDDIIKVVDLYHEMSGSVAFKKRESMSVPELQTAMKEKGLSNLKKDGTENNQRGTRLAINKYTGRIKSIGLSTGKFDNDDAAKAYIKSRFKKLVTIDTMPDDELDRFD